EGATRATRSPAEISRLAPLRTCTAPSPSPKRWVMLRSESKGALLITQRLHRIVLRCAPGGIECGKERQRQRQDEHPRHFQRIDARGKLGEHEHFGRKQRHPENAGDPRPYR